MSIFDIFVSGQRNVDTGIKTTVRPKVNWNRLVEDSVDSDEVKKLSANALGKVLAAGARLPE